MTTSKREEFELYVKRNRVFVLGAGFSAAAGVPMTRELLVRAMQKFSNECPGIYERVRGYAAECACLAEGELEASQIDFASLCTFLEYIELREYGGGERWSAVGSREKLALRFYLAKTIVECTPALSALPRLYLEFANQLHDRDVIISLNWDGLLELALEAVGKTYTYNLADGPAIKLCKLHGSVNWRLGAPGLVGESAHTLAWQSLDFTKGMMDREMYHSRLLLDWPTWSKRRPLAEVEPFLVLPGYGKAFDVRANATLWYKPEFAFSTTHDVFIIGLGLSPDDFLVRSFFLANLPYINAYSGVDGRRTVIINPDMAAASNYDFVLRHGQADLVAEPFSSKHIEFMTKRLNNACA